MTLCPASLTCGLLLCAALWNIPDVVAVEATEFLVPIGNNVSFPCNETSEPVWVIATTNGTLITDRKNDRHQLTENRIFPQNDSDGREYLTVQATAANNNSIIRCRSKGISPDFYLFAKLKVLGPPSYPEPLLQSINATALLLSWSPPFTWANYEILMYSIKMVNTCDGDTVVRNIDAAHDDTIITEYFHTPNGEATQSCSLLEFAVSATSAIGESRPGNISGGFPIVPRNFTVDHEVSFRKDGTPQLRVEFVPPYICPFQMAEYSIEIQQTGSNEIFTFGPEEYTYPEALSIQLHTPARLVVNAEYTLTVTASTVAGNSSFTSNFCTDFSPPTTVTTGTTELPHSAATELPHSAATELPHSAATELPHSQTSQLSFPLTVGIAVGGSAAIVLLILSIVCALMCLCSLRKRPRPATLTTYKGPPPTPMVDNPLYIEAQEHVEHYEHIDPHLVVQRPATRPPFRHPGPPSVPPPRKRNETDSGRDSIKSVGQISSSSGEYTSMHPARMMANLPSGGNTNDEERYAIHMSD